MKRLYALFCLLFAAAFAQAASLTPAQLVTLKAAIAADQTLAAQPMSGSGTMAIVEAMNAAASPDFPVWRTECPAAAIFDAITWDKYTPTDAPDGTAVYTNRLLSVQTKQMNLQNMLTGRTSIDMTKANIRAGLRDAVIALPTGASGAATTAGGVSGATVLTACTRLGRRIEKVLTTGSATTGSTTANLMGYEGAVSVDDVQQARELP